MVGGVGAMDSFLFQNYASSLSAEAICVWKPWANDTPILDSLLNSTRLLFRKPGARSLEEGLMVRYHQGCYVLHQDLSLQYDDEPFSPPTQRCLCNVAEAGDVSLLPQGRCIDDKPSICRRKQVQQ